MRLGLREAAVWLSLALAMAVLWVWAPGFFAGQPLLSLATRASPALLVACGMALVMVCRDIDISVGSQFSVCCVGGGLMLAAGWSPAAVLPASMALGALMGSVNGALVAGLGLPSIVVSLATMVSLREGLRWWREGVWVDLPEGTQWFGATQGAGQWSMITAALLITMLLTAGTHWMAGGRWIYASGSNAEATRLAGVNTRWVRFGVFTMLGALTGLAAMMNVVQSPQVDPNSGLGLELKVIAAAVVGGVAISGGRGSLPGVLGGLLLLSSVAPALAHLHVDARWEKVVQGVVILLAVAAEGFRARRNETRGRAK